VRSSIALRFAAVAIAASLGCRESTAPVQPDPIPAGTHDASWASIGKVCTPASPATSLSAARVESLPPRPSYRHPDNEFEDAARVVPGGFGGVLVQDGWPAFYLVDTTQHAAAQAALATQFPILYSPSSRVLQGRWDFAQLHDWFRYLQMRLGPLGLIGLSDVDEAKNRIHFGVVNEQARPKIEAALASLDVPCYLVAVDIEPMVFLLTKKNAQR